MGTHLIDSHDKQNIMKAFAVLALLPFVACGPAHPVPAPHYGSYHQPAPYHAPAPAYGHHAPAYGHPAPHYGGYGYEEPKHNCTVQDVTEIADVCVPAFETVCAPVELAIKSLSTKNSTTKSPVLCVLNPSTSSPIKSVLTLTNKKLKKLPPRLWK